MIDFFSTKKNFQTEQIDITSSAKLNIKPEEDHQLSQPIVQISDNYDCYDPDVIHMFPIEALID